MEVEREVVGQGLQAVAGLRVAPGQVVFVPVPDPGGEVRRSALVRVLGASRAVGEQVQAYVAARDVVVDGLPSGLRQQQGAGAVCHRHPSSTARTRLAVGST